PDVPVDANLRRRSDRSRHVNDEHGYLFLDLTRPLRSFITSTIATCRRDFLGANEVTVRAGGLSQRFVTVAQIEERAHALGVLNALEQERNGVVASAVPRKLAGFFEQRHSPLLIRLGMGDRRIGHARDRKPSRQHELPEASVRNGHTRSKTRSWVVA